MHKLVLIQRVLPIYREPLFEELRSQSEAAGFDFELWVSLPDRAFMSRGTAGSLNWAKVLPVIPLFGKAGIEWQIFPFSKILAADVVIVPDNLRVLSNMAVLLIRSLFRKKTICWGHGVNFQPSALSKILSSLRIFLLKRSSAYLLYTEHCLEPMLRQGFKRESIHFAQNAIDSKEASDLHPEHPEVMAFREANGLGQKPCIAFLGSWYASKNPGRILEIGEHIRKRIPDAQMLVIGGGDGLHVLRSIEVPWLSLLGPLHGRDKYVALSTCQCLAITGLAGLNVLDAMAVKLPVVVSNRDDHSPEISFVKNKFNGLIVGDTSKDIADACVSLLENNELWSRLSHGAAETARDLTIEKMASNLLAPVIDVVKMHG